MIHSNSNTGTGSFPLSYSESPNRMLFLSLCPPTSRLKKRRGRRDQRARQTPRLEKAQQSHASAWAPLLLLQSALANIVTVFIIWLFLIFSHQKEKWQRRRRREYESLSFIAWSRRQPSKPSLTQSSSVMSECCKVY